MGFNNMISEYDKRLDYKQQLTGFHYVLHGTKIIVNFERAALALGLVI